MAKGQAKLQEQATQRSAAQEAQGTAAVKRLEDNPELTAYTERTKKNRESLDNGTFQNSSDFASNRDAVAQRNSQRAGVMDMANTGFGAIGANYADPNQLALTNQILKDENARDLALQAQQDKRDFQNKTAIDEENVINKRVGIDQSIAGISYGQSNYNFSQAANIASQRASLVPGLIGAAVSGTAGILSGGLTAGGIFNKAK